MRAMEFAKGQGRALALTVAPENVDGFAQEMREVKAALLDWRAQHGDRCEMVMLTVVAAPKHHAPIEAMLEQVYRDEEQLAPLLQSLEVQVVLLDANGKPARQYQLGKMPPPANASRPWWKFW